MKSKRLICEAADGNWNKIENQCEFDSTSNNIDCAKRTVKAGAKGATHGLSSLAVESTKELIQCKTEKYLLQKTHEKLELSGEDSEFTKERTHTQITDIRQDTKRERAGHDNTKEEQQNQIKYREKKDFVCPSCNVRMERGVASVYACPECSYKFIEDNS